MKPSDVSCGFAHEVAITLAKAGWEITDIDALAKSEERCREILPFLRGHAKIKLVEHIIDCSAPPFCPDGWTVLPPKEQIPTCFTGSLKWDREAQKEMFHLSKKQMGKWIEGNELRKELEDKKIVALPANVLDYLLANQHLIPEEWKRKSVFFWGTIYRLSDDNLYVLYIYWNNGSWSWDFLSLDYLFYPEQPAALPASQN